MFLQTGRQSLDGLGIAPFGHKQHVSVIGVSGQGDVAVASDARGPVSGPRCGVRVVGQPFSRIFRTPPALDVPIH
jgi:hypothetical protein